MAKKKSNPQTPSVQNILYIDPGLYFDTISEINKKYPNAFANAKKAAKKVIPIMDENANEFRPTSKFGTFFVLAPHCTAPVQSLHKLKKKEFLM